MKRDVSVETQKAQFMVEKAIGDITRATRKVLMDYVSRMYVRSFAKAIAYLGLESVDAIDLLDNMDYDTRRQVEAFAEEAVHNFQNETSIFQKKIEEKIYYDTSVLNKLKKNELFDFFYFI